MKKLIFVFMCFVVVGLFGQEPIDKSEYREIGDGRDLAWEVDEVLLTVGEKITWTSDRAWQSGRWINDSTTGTNSNVSADRNWRLDSGTHYRFFGIVTGVQRYEGRMQTAIRVHHVEEIPAPTRR